MNFNEEFLQFLQSKGINPDNPNSFNFANSQFCQTPTTGSNSSPIGLSGIHVDDDDNDDNDDVEGSNLPKGRIKYSLEETKAVARLFVDISEDPLIGNQQTNKVFWEKIASRYNNGVKPFGALDRDYIHLRKHWGRVQKDISKFAGYYNNLQKVWKSGASEMDVRREALGMFYTENGNKHFKYEEVWVLVKDHPKFCGSTDCAPKRTKVSADGQYSTSGDADHVTTPGTDDGFHTEAAPSGSRPMGQKAARRKAKGKAAASSGTAVSDEFSELAEKVGTMGTAMMINVYYKALSKDTSKMSDAQRQKHDNFVDTLGRKLGFM